MKGYNVKMGALAISLRRLMPFALPYVGGVLRHSPAKAGERLRMTVSKRADIARDDGFKMATVWSCRGVRFMRST